MDQITCVAATEGHALFVDFLAEAWWPVPVPQSLAIHVVHSGVHRRLDTSSYAERRRECELAAAEIGPLRAATVDDLGAIRDPIARRRARHVLTENGRVRAMIHALRTNDLRTAGVLLGHSHRSLRDDFEVSIPAVDELVERLCATAGVYGARLTGAGFGGCVVAFAANDVDLSGFGGWRVRPTAGVLSPGRAESSAS